MQKEIQLQKPFSKVTCKDIGTLILIQGDQVSLLADADEELLSQLVAEVRGDTLVLGLEDDWFGQMEKVFLSIFNNTDRKVIYQLTVPDLNQISISGKMDLACESFRTDALKLKVSGLGK